MNQLPYYETCDLSDKVIEYICSQTLSNCQFQPIIPYKPIIKKYIILSVPLTAVNIYLYVQLFLNGNIEKQKNQQLVHDDYFNIQDINNLNLTQDQVFQLLTGRKQPKKYFSEMFNMYLSGRDFKLYTFYAIFNMVNLILVAQQFLGATNQFNKYIEQVESFRINFLVLKIINILNVSYNNIFCLVCTGLCVLPSLQLFSELFDNKEYFFTYFDKEYVQIYEKLRFQVYCYNIKNAAKKSKQTLKFFESDKDLKNFTLLMQKEIKFYLINGQIISSSAFPNLHNLGFKFSDVYGAKIQLIREQNNINKKLEACNKQEIPLQTVIKILQQGERPSFSNVYKKFKSIWNDS